MKKTAILALVLLATPLLAQPGPQGGPGNGAGRRGKGMQASVTGTPLSTYLESIPKGDLGAAEVASLVLLREEEKLARDVYRALFAAHGDRAFANVAAAEQRHMDLVKLLLDRYGIADPAAGAAPGEFRDARLAALYAEMVAKGGVSLVEALKVGATIEDLDLADVGKALAATGARDVKAVLANLAKGSRNHLRAFSRRLEALGASYTAQYLPAAELAAIVAAPRERGAVDENGARLAGTGECRDGRGQGQGRGRGKGQGAGGGPRDGSGPGCPKA